MRKRLADLQHPAAAALATWLVLTSPWVEMLRKIPPGAGFMEYAHVAAGLAALPVGAIYLAACLRRGGWRLYFPWAAGGAGSVARDLRGLLRGRIPSAEGGGLFATVEGLLLLAFLAAAATGAGWLLAQGTSSALAWRAGHIAAAWAAGALLVAHVLSVSLHVIELLRD